jgi:hypothetical protein
MAEQSMTRKQLIGLAGAAPACLVVVIIWLDAPKLFSGVTVPASSNA